MKETINIYQEIIRIQESGEGAALCILISVDGSAPQIASAKMIVKESGEILGTVGGGAIENKLAELSLEVINSQQAKTVKLNLVTDLNMACGGQVQAYIEPIEGRDHLIIYGAGHIALPTCSIAKMLGFHVTVVDDRSEWANAERFPMADRVVVSDFLEFAQKYKASKKDFILIVTRGHTHDQTILETVTHSDFGWLGMIGSRRKISAAFVRLKEVGITEEVISRIESPVGLDIGAVSPEEISISVAARLIEFKRKNKNARPWAI